MQCQTRACSFGWRACSQRRGRCIWLYLAGPSQIQPNTMGFGGGDFSSIRLDFDFAWWFGLPQSDHGQPTAAIRDHPSPDHCAGVAHSCHAARNALVRIPSLSVQASNITGCIPHNMHSLQVVSFRFHRRRSRCHQNIFCNDAILALTAGNHLSDAGKPPAHLPPRTDNASRVISS